MSARYNYCLFTIILRNLIHTSLRLNLPSKSIDYYDHPLTPLLLLLSYYLPLHYCCHHTVCLQEVRSVMTQPLYSSLSTPPSVIPSLSVALTSSTKNTAVPRNVSMHPRCLRITWPFIGTSPVGRGIPSAHSWLVCR